MQRLDTLLGQYCSRFLMLHDQYRLPFEELYRVPPKISKGERYGGLPWLMLDFPRYFVGDNHFAIRLFVWWGKFAGLYWHTAGSFAEMAAKKHFVLPAWEAGFVKDPYLFEEATDNFITPDSDGQRFYRIAKRYPLTDLWLREEQLTEDYKQILLTAR